MPINEKIKHFILTELAQDFSQVELTDTIPLIDSGILDSFGIMSLLGYLEESFSVEISGDDLVPDNFSSIETISKFISQKSSAVIGVERGL